MLMISRMFIQWEKREKIQDKNSLTVVFPKEVSLKNPQNVLGILSCGGIVLVHQKLW